MAVSLHVVSHGALGNPPVLLLHGLFGASTNWGSVARRLAADHHVLVPDLRNHGRSPHSTDMSYAAMVDDVLGLLDAQGLAQTTIIGHSMGGKVAMHLALNHPQRVARLGVVDIAPVTYQHDFDNILAAFHAVALDTLQSRADADKQMAGSGLAEGVRAFLLQNLVKGDDGWAWRVNLDTLARAQSTITAFPSQPNDARFEGATHFIHGALSSYVLPEHETTIRQFFPNARWCPVDGAGHWVYAERPEGFKSCLDAFL